MKPFFVTTGLVFIMIWLFAGSDLKIANGYIGTFIIIIVFALTYAWVKHEFFNDKK